MGTTTTYDVLLRYRLNNEATKDAEKLRHGLEGAHHSANELGHVLAHIGMIAGGAMSIHGAWEHLVKFNSEVENAKISLAAMVEGGFGGSFNYAKNQAESLYKEFQKFSTQTPMTTQEMLEFSRGVAVSVQQSGGGIKDIVNVTEQGAIAAKALGMESHYAAREIAEMLAGNVNNRMLFAKQLAGLGGKTTEDIRHMGTEERLAFLKQTLNSPAMKDAVASMSSSFSGVTSTLVDKVQILLGKVGLPLFKAITAEVSRWNDWIDKNDEAINRFAKTVGEGLVTAFQTVKDVFGFIYDHADTFIMIGKTWAAIKIGNMAGNLLGLAGGGGAMGLLGNLGTPVSKLGGNQVLGAAMATGMISYELTKMTGVGDRFAGALSEMGITSTKLDRQFEDVIKASKSLDDAFHDAASRMGSEGFASRAQATQDQREAQIGVLKSLITEANDSGVNMDSRRVRDKLSAVGLTQQEVGEVRDLNGFLANLVAQRGHAMAQHDIAGITGATLVEALERSSLTEYQRQTLNEQKAADEVFGAINRKLAAGGTIFDPNLPSEILKILRENTADPEGRHKAITEKPKVNVTIHRIEVQSDDPDRYAMRFVQSFRDAAKNPGQSIAVLREG